MHVFLERIVDHLCAKAHKSPARSAGATVRRDHLGVVDPIQRTATLVIVVVLPIIIVKRFDSESNNVIPLIDEESRWQLIN